MGSGKELSKDMLEVLTSYEETSQSVIKQNLKDSISLDSTKENYGSRKDIAKFTGMEINSLQSCLNTSHASKITFENLVRLCGNLNLDIYSMFEDVAITNHTRNRTKGRVWNTENKQKFIDDFKTGGIDLVQETHALSDKTILHYFNVFSREIENN